MMTVRRFLWRDLPESIRDKLNKVSLFTSERFASLWSTVGGRPVCFLVEHSNECVAAFTGVEFGRLFWKRFQSMPDGTYARLVKLNNPVDIAQAGNTLMQHLRSAGYLKVYVYDFDRALQLPNNWNMSESHTHVVALTAKDWQPPDEKLRTEIRKAEREGVTFRPYDHSRDHDAFHALRRTTESRHGGSEKYPTRFYDSLAELAARDERVRWYVVECENKLAASHVYLRDGEMLLNWMVHFDKAFSSLKPNQFVTFNVARQGIENGITRLNLGSTPPEAESLITYKAKWGGEVYTYPCYHFKRGG